MFYLTWAFSVSTTTCRARRGKIHETAINGTTARSISRRATHRGPLRRWLTSAASSVHRHCRCTVVHTAEVCLDRRQRIHKAPLVFWTARQCVTTQFCRRRARLQGAGSTSSVGKLANAPIAIRFSPNPPLLLKPVSGRVASSPTSEFLPIPTRSFRRCKQWFSTHHENVRPSDLTRRSRSFTTGPRRGQ